MEFESKVFLVGASSREYVSKRTGNPTVFYSATVVDGGSVIPVRLSKEVFEEVKDMEKVDVVAKFRVEHFNGQVNGLSLVELV